MSSDAAIDARGVAHAAVAVQGPIVRVTEARVAEIGAAVQAAAAALRLPADHLVTHST